MHLDDALCDRQTEAGAAFDLGLRAVRLLEFVENLRLVRLGNAWAGVAHRNSVGAIRRRRLDGDLARVGELDRVADQIEQHLGQAAVVAAGRRQIWRHLDLECEFLVIRQRLDRAIDAVHHVFDGIILDRQYQLPGLDFRQIEHVVDQAEQMLAVRLHALHHGAHFFRRLAVNAVDNKLGIAENGIERRAQLVAHIGKELRFMLARFRDLPALVLDLFEQAHVLDSDTRLVGEGGRELDLLFGERPHGEPHQHDDPDGFVFAQQRNTEDGAKPDPFLHFLQRIVRIGKNVRNLNRPALEYRAPEYGTSSRREWNVV